MKLKTWSKSADNYLLTFETEPCWLFRLFGAKSKEVQYAGDCTVWYVYPDFRRCDTLMDARLCAEWKKIRHDEATRRTFGMRNPITVKKDERLDFCLIISVKYAADTPLMKVALHTARLIDILQRLEPELDLEYDEKRSQENLEDRSLVVVVAVRNLVGDLPSRLSELEETIKSLQRSSLA